MTYVVRTLNTDDVTWTFERLEEACAFAARGGRAGARYVENTEGVIVWDVQVDA